MIGVLKSAALLRTVEPACAQPLRLRRVLNGGLSGCRARGGRLLSMGRRPPFQVAAGH